MAHPALHPRLIFLAICALGVSAVTTQLVMMREMLCVYTGNELVFGVILANWLMLAGLGSLLGVTVKYVKDPLHVFIPAQIAVALLPPVMIYAVRILRNVVFLRGVMIGPLETAAGTLVILLPYCLLTGYLLTLACHLLSTPRRNCIGRVYCLDVLGDIVGGLLFTFLLVHYCNHFQVTYLSAMLNLGFSIVIAACHGKRIITAAGITILATFLVTISLVDLDHSSIIRRYSRQRVVYHGESPYPGYFIIFSFQRIERASKPCKISLFNQKYLTGQGGLSNDRV